MEREPQMVKRAVGLEGELYRQSMVVPACDCSYCVPWARVDDNFINHPHVARYYHQDGIPVVQHPRWPTTPGPRIAWAGSLGVPNHVMPPLLPSNPTPIRNQQHQIHLDLKRGVWQVPHHASVTQHNAASFASHTTLVHSCSLNGVTTDSVRQSAVVAQQRSIASRMTSRYESERLFNFPLEMPHGNTLTSAKLCLTENGLPGRYFAPPNSHLNVTHSPYPSLLWRGRLPDQQGHENTQITSKAKMAMDSDYVVGQNIQEVNVTHSHPGLRDVTRPQSALPTVLSNMDGRNTAEQKEVGSSVTGTMKDMKQRDKKSVTQHSSFSIRNSISVSTALEQDFSKYGMEYPITKPRAASVGTVTQPKDRDNGVKQWNKFGSSMQLASPPPLAPDTSQHGGKRRKVSSGIEPYVTPGEIRDRLRDQSNSKSISASTHYEPSSVEARMNSMTLFQKDEKERKLLIGKTSIKSEPLSDERFAGRLMKDKRKELVPEKSRYKGERNATLSRNNEGTTISVTPQSKSVTPSFFDENISRETLLYRNRAAAVSHKLHQNKEFPPPLQRDMVSPREKIVDRQMDKHSSNEIDSITTQPTPNSEDMSISNGFTADHSVTQPVGVIPGAACTCSFCGKSFGNTRALELHVRRHSGLRPYACKFCNKSFYQPSERAVHMRTHTGARPYRCPHCLKLFRYSGDLKQHINIHTGQRPYQCEICAKAFTNHSTLRQHRRIHTGERPYQCTMCFRTYRYHSSLKQHLATHGKGKTEAVLRMTSTGTEKNIQTNALKN